MKTLREYIDQLDEISRRDFLKGAGAAALAGAAGYAAHKDVSQDQYVDPLYRLVGRLSEYYTSGVFSANELRGSEYQDVANWIRIVKTQLLNPAMHRPPLDAFYKEYQLGQQEGKRNIKRLSSDQIRQEFSRDHNLAMQAWALMKDNKGFDRQKYEKFFKEEDLEEASPDAVKRIEELVKYK